MKFFDWFSKPIDQDQELKKKEEVVKKHLQESQVRLYKSMEFLHSQQKFYYAGLTYHGGTVIVTSAAAHGLRTLVPFLKRIPFILFPASGYFLGGALWKVHQAVMVDKTIRDLTTLLEETQELQKIIPSFSECGTFIYELNKTLRHLETQSSIFSRNLEAHGHNDSSSDANEIASQILQRNLLRRSIPSS